MWLIVYLTDNRWIFSVQIIYLKILIWKHFLRFENAFILFLFHLFPTQWTCTEKYLKISFFLLFLLFLVTHLQAYEVPHVLVFFAVHYESKRNLLTKKRQKLKVLGHEHFKVHVKRLWTWYEGCRPCNVCYSVFKCHFRYIDRCITFFLSYSSFI